MPIGSMGRTVYLRTDIYIVDFLVLYKYTVRPMDPMGCGVCGYVSWHFGGGSNEQVLGVQFIWTVFHENDGSFHGNNHSHGT